MYKTSENMVIFIVGGDTFKTFPYHFNKWPESRLSRLIKAKTEGEILELCDEYCVDSSGIKTYTFYRNPDHFNTILDVYRANEVHCINHCCTMTTKEELDYWGSDELAMELCCSSKYSEKNKIHKRHKKRDKDRKTHELNVITLDDQFGNSFIQQIRKKIWHVIENPRSSTAAQVTTSK